MVIYSLTNKANGKRYIGQTTHSVEWRWRQHCKHANSVHFPVYHALRKYGAKNFTVEVLAAACSVDCLNYLETIAIAVYNSQVPNGYNLDGGGKNNTVHPDTIARMSAGKKGKKFTPEHRAKISAAQTGGTRTLEQRARQSSAIRGREVTVEEYGAIYRARHSPKPKRTHCRKGHLLPDGPNVLDRGRAYRRCRVCVLEYQRNYDKTVRLAPHGRVVR